MRTRTTPNALHHLREAADLTQAEVAALVNIEIGRPHDGPVTANAVSRWERGEQQPSRIYQQALCVVYRCDLADLNLTSPEDPPSPLPFLDEAPTVAVDPRVTRSQEQWRKTRRALNANRPALARLAAGLYPQAQRFGDTGLLVGPGWALDEPIDLASIRLNHRPDATPPAITGGEPESAHVRPCHTLTRPYSRYTQAIRDIEAPRLLANRETWRLVGVDWTQPVLDFATTSYFAAIDVCEAVAHETAMVALTSAGRLAAGRLLGRDLPFRRLVGDPFSPDRLAVAPAAISTLTIRGGSEPTFLLHRRDSKSVAVAGGSLQVIPSGVFQPSSVPACLGQDFDLWRNVMREFSEELLGNPEHGGDSEPCDYDREPFATLDTARTSGRLRIYCLGAALDGLTLFGEILSVVVVDPDLFDRLAADFVDVNEEGTVVAERLPFTDEVVGRVLGSGRMSPAGAGCLSLAWRHRGLLGVG